jgi:hypothetical protein
MKDSFVWPSVLDGRSPSPVSASGRVKEGSILFPMRYPKPSTKSSPAYGLIFEELPSSKKYI